MNGVPRHLHIVRSDGGLMSAVAASERPVHTVLSGPAGGVDLSTAMVAHADGPQVAARLRHGRHLDRRLGHSRRRADHLALDGSRAVSGQGSDASTCAASAPAAARSPTSPNSTGSLRVGPRSAGARPGPVSYGRGGTEPTVSDANVVLGYLPQMLLGGSMDARCRGGARRGRHASPASSACPPSRRRRASCDIANERHARRAARHHGAARPRSARIRHRRLRRRRARCMPTRMAEVLGCYPGGRAALARRAVGARLPRGRVQERVRADLHPLDRRDLDPAEIWSTLRRAPRQQAEDLARRAGDRAGAPIAITADSLDLRYEQQGFEVTVDLPARGRPDGRASPRRHRPLPRACMNGSMACASTCRSSWWRCASSARRRDAAGRGAARCRGTGSRSLDGAILST